MAKAAQSQKLRAAFEKHQTETDGQVERLEQVFASIGQTARGKTCDAIMGILDEGKEIMSEYKGVPALDAGLLAAAQAVEHYEISPLRYVENVGEGRCQITRRHIEGREGDRFYALCSS